jgi:divalent metal cation (Fe/Co/Zn/Cd) transporter
LTNSVGLAAALLSNQYYWWIDKVGAMVLALYTITNWGKSVIENAASLVGQAAPPELVAKVTYMAFNHHQKIRKLDTVRAFLLGGLYFVEVCRQLLCTFLSCQTTGHKGNLFKFLDEANTMVLDPMTDWF